MNLTLKKPDLEHYSNGNHLEFHETLYRIFDKHKEVIDAPLLLSAYQDKVQQENNSFNRLRSSELTEKKAETDYRRDRVLAQLIGVLRPLGKHFNPAIRNQARHVLALIRNYGDLVHTHYDAATIGIDCILEQLAMADYRPAVEALHLDAWLTELERLNRLFKRYVVDTQRELVQKPNIRPEIVRKETNAAMRDITREKKDGSVAVVELVFSRDFEVGYRNNVEPGTATLIITGIGRYRGEMTTRFNIRREREMTGRA
jgi:hypothetical protein